MTMAVRRPLGPNYAFVAVGIAFLALLAAAGLRAAPGVLILPLEKAFGWDRGTISLAAAIGIFLYGLTGPFAAALMQSFGVRRTVTLALILMAASTGLSTLMTASWQFVATWGVLAGLGSGAVAMVMGATVVNRWFVARRGLMMGLLSAATATGTLIFLPGFAWLAETFGWAAVAATVAIVTGLLAPIVWLLLPDRPPTSARSRTARARTMFRRPASPAPTPWPAPSGPWVGRPGRGPSGCCSWASSSAA